MLMLESPVARLVNFITYVFREIMKLMKLASRKRSNTFDRGREHHEKWLDDPWRGLYEVLDSCSESLAYENEHLELKPSPELQSMENTSDQSDTSSVGRLPPDHEHDSEFEVYDSDSDSTVGHGKW